MTFEQAVIVLKESVNKLPGEEAQFKMAPISRQQKQNYLLNDGTPKKSAVCILIYPKNNLAHVALIQRQEYQGAHSAQISFPGGKMDESDGDFETTALRELHEEVGVKITPKQIIGRLTDLYIPVSKFHVQPVLSFIDKSPTFLLNEREVAELIELPLLDLLSEAIVTSKAIALSTSVTINTPCFVINNKIVWGATAMILSELKQMLL